MKTIEAIDVLVSEMIHDALAPNYKGWIVADEITGNEYVITVQDKDGESPSEQLAEAKAEIAELVDVLSAVVDTHAIHKGNEAAYLVSMKHINEMLMVALAKHKGE